MKKTTLNQKHIDLGAKMVPFAGYEMPVQYAGVKEEHLAVRSSLGIFDVSHMGEFFLKGPEAIDLLQKITTNDVSKLSAGKIQYTCMPNGNGGIVDDLLVYCISKTVFMLVVNASNIAKDWNWINEHNTFDVALTDHSEKLSLLAIQGPAAVEALQSLTEVNLNDLAYYSFTIGKFAGVENVLISATGYTGAGGFEIYVENGDVEKIWDAVMEAGKAFNIQPCGLAARDTLRLEMGFCLYGNDIDETTSPIEAGLGWITKFSKDFIDKDRFEKQKKEGTGRNLVGFEMVDRAIPRKDYPILDADGNKIGEVTSGTQSPSLDKAIGMGYVKSEFKTPGTEIFIDIRQKPKKAVVTRPPFYKKDAN